LDWQCNKAVAYFRDNIDLFKNAVAYFLSPPVTAALGREVFGRVGRVKRKWRSKKERREYMARMVEKKAQEKVWFARVSG